MRKFSKAIFTFAIVLSCALFPNPTFAKAVLVLSSGSTHLDAQVRTILEKYGHTVTIGASFLAFNGEGLAGQNVVLMLVGLDPGTGNMPAAGQTALVNFVTAGGGLVTSEWTVYMSAFRSFQTLSSIFPVYISDGYGENTPITYQQATPNAVINDGMPASFTFSADDFYGTETFLSPQPAATVFYWSKGSAGGGGVVGWRFGLGRVLQFSTLVSFQEMADPTFSRLVANSASWAGTGTPQVTALTLDPAAVRVGSSSVARFSGSNLTDSTYFDVQFRRPSSTIVEENLNWQQGASATHSIPRGTTVGTWLVTGVRAHADKDDHADPFVPIQTSLNVVDAPWVTSANFDPQTVSVGASSTTRFSGTDLVQNTYFDVRFRAPASTTDDVVLNWQQGISLAHTLPLGTRLGNWTITGVRAHQNRDDHIGEFDPLSAVLTLVQSPCFLRIASGEIQGIDLGASCAFLGVPYAAPPTGNLRWKPPQPSLSWTSVLAATTAPLSCTASEDCLLLNVWTPKPIPVTPEPVIVWFHSGSFVQSSANFSGNNGQKLAEQRGVIVVAPNYRLGPFGFLAHPALTNEIPGYRSSGNYGFLDQRAALVWVRDNIRLFGGDQNNVTISGQSAGAHSVSLHMTSPGSRSLFHRAVMESGYASTRWTTRGEAEVQGNDFARALGCTDASQALTCMRAQSRDRVLAALTIGREEFLEQPVRWNPVVDGIEIPDQPRLLFERGAFNRVPVLLGANRDEGWTYVDRSFPNGLTTSQYAAAIQLEFGSAASDITAAFRFEDFANPKEALVRLTGDVEYACEAARLALYIQRTGTPVYLYSFEYVVDGLVSNRVIHGLETNFVFGNNYNQTAPFPANRPLTTADLALSNAMGGYWTRFAATGDPNTTTDKGIVPWPTFGSGQYIILDSVIRQAEGLHKQQCDALQPFFFRTVNGPALAATP